MMGRPRKLSRQDLLDVIHWSQSRKSRKKLAAEKGVSEDTIERVIAAYRDRNPKLLHMLKGAVDVSKGRQLSMNSNVVRTPAPG